MLVREAGLQLAREQVPDVHGGVGRPGGQEAAVRAERAKRVLATLATLASCGPGGRGQGGVDSPEHGLGAVAAALEAVGSGAETKKQHGCDL